MLGLKAFGDSVVGNSFRRPTLGLFVGRWVNSGLEVSELNTFSRGNRGGELSDVRADFDGFFEVFDINSRSEPSSGCRGGGITDDSEIELLSGSEFRVDWNGILGLGERTNASVFLSLEDISGQFDDGGFSGVSTEGKLLLDKGSLGVGNRFNLGDVEVEGFSGDFAVGGSFLVAVCLHFVKDFFENFLVLAVELLVLLSDFGFLEHSTAGLSGASEFLDCAGSH